MKLNGERAEECLCFEAAFPLERLYRNTSPLVRGQGEAKRRSILTLSSLVEGEELISSAAPQNDSAITALSGSIWRVGKSAKN